MVHRYCYPYDKPYFIEFIGGFRRFSIPIRHEEIQGSIDLQIIFNEPVIFQNTRMLSTVENTKKPR